MTTAAYPIAEMHPWFRMPTLKRKSYSTDSSNSSASDVSDLEAIAHHTPKRRKCEVLETGIAQLSLDPALQSPYSPYLPSQIPSINPSTPWADTASYAGNIPHPSPPSGWAPSRAPNVPPGTFPIVFPGSVEEPTSPHTSEEPEIPEIKMKGTSWYEPEKDRIVITDLDDDSDIDEPETSGGLSVNSALMSRLKNNLNPDPIPREPDSSRALVLFRPLTIPDITEHEEDQHQEEHNNPADGVIVDDYIGPSPVADDDAMDIEYL